MIRSLVGLMVLVALGSAWASVRVQEQLITCDKPEHALNAVVLSDETAIYAEEERACWIDWEQDHLAAKREGYQWVDVRDAGSARNLILPGIAAVHWADLGDKTFLRGQSLVLLGVGTDLKKLTGLCVDLRHSGQFETVHVLLGGVRSWRMAGQPVQINGFVQASHEVSAHELWLGASDGLWQVATIGLSPEQIASLPVPREYVLDLGADIQQASKTLIQQIGREPLPAPREWLVIADTYEQFNLAWQLWQQLDVTVRPFWLSGAWPAYAVYLEQQKNLAAHAGQPLAKLCGM